jgi:hypothetical protein
MVYDLNHSLVRLKTLTALNDRRHASTRDRLITQRSFCITTDNFEAEISPNLTFFPLFDVKTDDAIKNVFEHTNSGPDTRM